MEAEEKAQEVLKLTEEIKEIKSFCYKLERESCWTGKGCHAFIKKETKSYLFGTWKTGIISEKIPIPDKLNIEIHATCLKWIEELERRIEVLIPKQQ